MGSKKNFLFQKGGPSPQTLLEFLKEQVVGEKKIRFSDSQLTDYIRKGFVKIDDRIERRPDQKLRNTQFVSIVLKIEDIKKVQRPPKSEFTLTKDMILFEDDDIVIVNKPYGIPTHATLDPDRDFLVAGLKRFFKTRDGKVPYIGLHHRLDKDTSGVVLFTKRTSANKGISEVFEKRQIEKTYIAAVFSKNLKKEKWTVENYLARKENARVMEAVSKDKGDHAITHIEVLKKGSKHSLLTVRPVTGRTHQIRIHLLDSGAPILGDIMYFKDGSELYDRLFLHAYKLRIRHPSTKFMLEVEAPLPKEFEALL